MAKQMKKLDVSRIIETANLNYDTNEVIDNIEAFKDLNPLSSIRVEDHSVWLKPEKPEIVNTIAEDLKQCFNITSKEFVFTLYYQPEKIDGKFIKKCINIINPNKKILHRVLVSTIGELIDIGVAGIQSDKMRVKSWEAVKSIPFISAMLEYKFNNNNCDKLEAKKGFRPVVIKKDVSKRFILIFDFLEKKEEVVEETEDFGDLIDTL